MTVWDRYTEEARRVVYDAQEEARSRGTRVVGPEHFLLALLQPHALTPVGLLETLGVEPTAIRAEVTAIVPRTAGTPDEAEMSMAPPGKHLLDRALAEAESLGDLYIGAEHLLLGLLAMHPEPALRVRRVLFGRGEQPPTRWLRTVLHPLTCRKVTVERVRERVRLVPRRVLVRASEAPEALMRPAANTDEEQVDRLLRADPGLGETDDET